MSPADRQHRLGIILIVAAAIAWSSAPFFTRLLHYDSWSILFWRGLFGGGSIALYLILTQGGRGARDVLVMGAVIFDIVADNRARSAAIPPAPS